MRGARLNASRANPSHRARSPENTALKQVFRVGNASVLNVYTVGCVVRVPLQSNFAY